MSAWSQMQTGLSGIRTASHRALFLQRSETFLAQGKWIDGALSRDPGNGDVTVLRIGLLMGKVTSSSMYAPAILGVTTGAVAAGATTISAAAAVVTELVRRVGASGTFKLTGPASANGTVVTETVTYSAASSTSITVTATVNAFVAGSLIQPTDGSEQPITMIPDTQAYGIKVTDLTGTSVAAVDFPKVPISGIVSASQLLPVWPSDTSLRAWISARLNGVEGGQFVMDSRY
jgi:hypothetical protein